MRIGVVSDTHLPRFGRELPRALRDGLRDEAVELILHLGDMTDPMVPGLFERIASFDGVAGNNDGRELEERFGRRKIVEAGGKRFGLVHGDQGLARTTPERARSSYNSGDVDAVLFGHSHMPLLERLPDGRLLLNPGSPTDKRAQPRYSWAIIQITSDGRIDAEIRYFDDRST
ncbi:MAG: metallophosphoesterase family protein [Chloroflexota bacterium]